MITRRSFLATSSLALAGSLERFGVAPARADRLDKLTFGTNWKAQAEHGGYYQAVATGLYRKAGLDVTIRMGGPQVNHPQFLAAKTAIQQGFVTSEPYKIGSAGAKIVVHLLADAGYSSYATTIETSWKLVNEKPDVVQRFVNATIEGWYSYLYGDPGPANTLIKKENPDMGDDQITYSLGAMKKYGLVDSGDAATLGIGAMSDARWKDFHATMVEAGLYAPDLDLKRAYTLGFVNKKHGIQLKKT